MEHSAAIVMNHCDCEAEQMMNTRNEETVVTEVRRESLRLRSRADDEYGERRDRSNKAEGNHCDCEAEQMMTSVVCSSNYCLTASMGEESME